MLSCKLNNTSHSTYWTFLVLKGKTFVMFIFLLFIFLPTCSRGCFQNMTRIPQRKTLGFLSNENFFFCYLVNWRREGKVRQTANKWMRNWVLVEKANEMKWNERLWGCLHYAEEEKKVLTSDIKKKQRKLKLRKISSLENLINFN